MNIGIDISQIVYEGTGVARFTNGLVNAILNYDKNNQWTFFFSSLRQNLDKDIEDKIKQKGFKLIKWKLPPTLLSVFWNDFHNISKLFTFNFSLLTNLDWFITSDWTEPPLKCKKATIIHDLVYIRYPETLDKKIADTQTKRMTWIKKESNLIFSDSQATKDDINKYLKIDDKKIIVNYPGVNVTEINNGQINETLKKFNLNRPFILTVGKLEPRKNLDRLIQAMKQLNPTSPRLHGASKETIDLVIAGPKGWQQFSNETMKQLNNVKFLGYVSDKELSCLYRSSLFFIYPSIWEGFGYPILEAMNLGAPVATSDTSSLKEISGRAALLFDPLNIDDIYKSMKTLIQDKELRENLINKGKKRTELFTWRNYYNKLINSLK